MLRGKFNGVAEITAASPAIKAPSRHAVLPVVTLLAGLGLGLAATLSLEGLARPLGALKGHFAASLKDDARLATTPQTSVDSGSRQGCTALALDRLSGQTIAVACAGAPPPMPTLRQREIES